MDKSKIFAALAALLTVGGCTITAPLRPTDGEAQVGGSITRQVFEPHDVEIRVEGTVYRGQWRSGRPSPQQVAAAPYPRRKQAGLVELSLAADDGRRLACRFETLGSTANGVCRDGGRDYGLVSP